MIKYIKYYLEPDSKMVRQLAFESAREHFKNKKHVNLDFIRDFQEYQRGYISAYRSSYAKNKIREGA